jgi:hypothetical protein
MNLTIAGYWPSRRVIMSDIEHGAERRVAVPDRRKPVAPEAGRRSATEFQTLRRMEEVTVFVGRSALEAGRQSCDGLVKLFTTLTIHKKLSANLSSNNAAAR